MQEELPLKDAANKASAREELAAQRAAFAFFAAAFNTLPDAALVRSLRLQTAADAGTSEGSPAAPYAGWMDCLSDDEVLCALGRDRARLLRHVDEACIKPPYESLYVGQDENNVLSKLHAFFVNAGFAPTGECRQPADYLGMELAFLEECCAKEEAALDEGKPAEAERLKDIRQRFTAEHVSEWVPAYAASMRDAAQTGFYQSVAELLLASFCQD